MNTKKNYHYLISKASLFLIVLFLFAILPLEFSTQNASMIAYGQTTAGVAIDTNPSTRNYSNSLSSTDIEVSKSVAIGDTFEVAIVAQNVVNLDSYIGKVLFDQSKLGFVSGSFENTSEGMSNFLRKNNGTFVDVPVVEHSAGEIIFGGALKGQDTYQAPDGSGIITLITFRAIEAGNVTLALHDVVFTDSSVTQYQITNLSNGLITINNTNTQTPIATATATASIYPPLLPDYLPATGLNPRNFILSIIFISLGIWMVYKNSKFKVQSSKFQYNEFSSQNPESRIQKLNVKGQLSNVLINNSQNPLNKEIINSISSNVNSQWSNVFLKFAVLVLGLGILNFTSFSSPISMPLSAVGETESITETATVTETATPTNTETATISETETATYTVDISTVTETPTATVTQDISPIATATKTATIIIPTKTNTSIPSNTALPNTGRLKGKITSYGTPIAGSIVSALKSPNWDIVATAIADANGNYSILNLIPTNYRVKFDLPSTYPITTVYFRNKTSMSTSAIISVFAGEDTIDINLELGDILGTATPTKTPIFNASVTATITPTVASTSDAYMIRTCDFDSDNKVYFTDLVHFADHYLTITGDVNWADSYDLNKDNKVDNSDLAIFKQHWLEGI